MIKIRRANLDDAKKIVGLWKEFMEYLNDLLKRNPKLKPWIELKKNSHSIFRKFLKKNLKSKNSAVFLAEMDGMPAGYTLIFIKENIPIYKLEKFGYISDLFVKKEFRGKNISSKLKEKAIEWFKKKGLKHASIALWSDNTKAHSIYKKWGFFDQHIEMRKKL
ncbi:MAG: GNAT family N-acetyltransferase [Candidatus Diapherotrites archaeon]